MQCEPPKPFHSDNFQAAILFSRHDPIQESAQDGFGWVDGILFDVLQVFYVNIPGMEPPAALIEQKPLHHITVTQVLAMTWEAAPFRTR